MDIAIEDLSIDHLVSGSYILMILETSGQRS